ncbi:hypothetical protein HMPREF3291_06590 [Bacillus sp. HMSC76G11]|uniref:hypothetical protein n=1 Tax=Metabacillus idriensis TaxID=324768 RepID=UPI0008A918EE|nr:hypothetical protein [Metabacillus idriensis]OHR70653.1 hypothetical protein HMPREF3291_06590 [Bacillus sp. HMSC76G11]
MKILLHSFLSFLYIVYFTGVFYVLFLFLNIPASVIAGSIMALLLIGLFIYSIYEMIHRKERNLLFFKGLSGSIFLSITAISLIITLFFVVLMNVMTTHFNYQNISPREKFEFQVNAFLPIDPYEKYKEGAETKKISHLTVYYSSLNKRDILLVEDEFINARKISKRLFGDIEDQPIDLILLDESPDSLQELEYLDYMGFYDHLKETMAIVIPDDFDAASPLVVETFYHEYAHYYMEKALEKMEIDSLKIPIWFNEGVAEYAGYNGEDAKIHIDRVIPFNELRNPGSWATALEDSPEAEVYTQSFCAVKILTDEFGEDIIMELLLETGEASFEEALKKKTKYTYKDLEKKIAEKQKRTRN